MTTFDDREHAFEAHFALEEELDFKIQARRDRLLGVWAGGLMGLQGAGLEDYVLSLMRTDLREAGDTDVYNKVLSDLAGKGVGIDPHDVRLQMDAFLTQARAQLDGGSV